MCDMSDIRLAEVELSEAERENNMTAAITAWDHLTDLRRQYANEHQTIIPSNT